MVNITSAPYNLDNFTNISGILDFNQQVNEITGGWFFLLVLLAGFIITFSAMKDRISDNRDAFIGSFFVTVVIGAFLAAMDLIPLFIIAPLIILFAIVFTVRMIKE